MICILCSCSGKNSSESQGAEVDTLTTKELELSSDSLSLIKDKSLSTIERQKVLFVNNDYYYQQMKATKPVKNIKEYHLGAFTRLKNGQDQFQYFVLTDINFSERYKTKLIAEYYESEEACWLANYTLKGDFIDAMEVFYDNAEGAWQTTSKIDPNTRQIVLFSYDAYANPENTTDTIVVSANGFFPSSNKE